MNTEELEAYVVDRLGEGHARADIVLEVAERGALTWDEADDLVRRVTLLRRRSVAHRQFPILAAAAVAIIVGGFAVVVFCVHSFAEVALLAHPARGAAGRWNAVAVLAALAANSPSLGLLPLGAGMILGGILGLARAIRATSEDGQPR